MEVKFVNFGIGSRVGDYIYINKKLLDYPNLFKKILIHEKAHSNGFNRDDLIMDLDNQHLHGIKKEYYSFILKHPSSWTEFLPFGFCEGRFVFNPLILAFWLLGIFVTIGIVSSL